MHNATNFIDFNWWSFAFSEYILHPFIMIIVCLLSVFVVLGNLLVVSAIWHEHQLHSVTNYLIASLAAADCLVGAVVMPFSIISEIFIGTWTFGEAWCDLWHSFDVLASTASIMNLCAISLDRYLAITDPISYPTRMTPKRVALLIVSLWTCSSLISFPAIIWWRAVGQGPLQQLALPQTTLATISPSSNSNSLGQSPTMSTDFLGKREGSSEQLLELATNIGEPLYKCVFTDDPYYLLFSSFISFYGPLCVMLYAYYRIYKAAVQQTRFLKHGSKEVMVGKRKRRFRHFSEQSKDEKNRMVEASGTSGGGGSAMENYDRQHLVLRVHRGGGAAGSSMTRKLSNGDLSQSNSSANKNQVSNNNSNNNNDNPRKNHQDTHSESVATTASKLITSQAVSEQQQCLMVEKKSSQNAQSNNDLNGHQSILSNNHSRQLFNKSHPDNQTGASIRRNQINLVSSRRDKRRVDSQRFDVSPPEDGLMSNDVAIDSTSAQDVTRIQSPSIPITSEVTTSDSGLDEKLNKESHEANPKTKRKSSNQLKHYAACKGKPFVAFINNRSTSIDVSIMDRFIPVYSTNKNNSSSNIQQSPTSTMLVQSQNHLNHQHQHHHQHYHHHHHRQQHHYHHYHHHQHHQHHQRLKSAARSSQSSLKESIHLSVTDKIDRNNGYEPDYDEDVIGDLVDSDTTSTDSYGTGSIASVIVKPQPAIQNVSRDKNSRNNTSCDTNESFEGHTMKARRALSFSGAHHSRELKDLKDLREEQRDISSHRKYRGSYCDTTNSRCSDQSIVFKASKTLNIRSWVKATYSRQVKQQKNNYETIKPPPSLVPLMKMNSDTSTDSSNVPGSSNVQQPFQSSIGDKKPYKSNSNRSLANGQSLNGVRADKSTTLGKDLELGPEKLDEPRMLHYNSDKLDQGLVDLNAIHYIDCASPSSRPTMKGLELRADAHESKEAGKGMVVEKARGLNQQEEQAIPQPADVNRVAIPNHRQHRSMGKKLSKLAKERKAAKTLGIVVGVFILCWLPFFVVNIVVALCGANCIYQLQLVAPIVTWLGWLNSAMNPVIYACWSRDFRRAFRRVLCTWVKFICPYDGAYIARKLKLKKSSNFSHLNRNASSIKGNTSSATIRSGVSIDGRSGHSPCTGGVLKSFLILPQDQ